MKDHYQTLGVDRSASEKQLKQAYRELCKRNHPDHNKSPDAHARMQEINEARRVLSSPVSRAEYDQLLRLQEQQGQPTTEAAPSAGTTEGCRCEKCGRVDATLRVSVFTWVVSFLLLSYRCGWAKILCARCRTKYALLFDLQNFFMGWWGIPFGFFWTLQALWHNSLGGQQPEENNALFLAGLGYEFHRKGNLKAAASALKASLRFKKDPRVEAFYWQTQARFHESPAAYTQEPRLSLWQRLATGAFHPAVYCAPMLVILFWLASLWIDSVNKSPVRARSGAALQQDNSRQDTARVAFEENVHTGFARSAPPAIMNDTPKVTPKKPTIYNLDGTIAQLTPEEQAEILGLLKDEEVGVQLFDNKEYKRAFEPLRRAAESGQTKAQFYLASCYFNGQGIAKDEGEAVKWWRKAAEQNNSRAQNSLGICYNDGKGVAKDEVEAVKWYRKAAQQNYTPGQNNLGVCYERGQGVAKDTVEAVKWFRKAAEQNDAESQYNLGCCYFDGRGVVKDRAEAVKWFRKAAEQNHAKAQSVLATYYDMGQGVAKDGTEAVKGYHIGEENHVQQNRADGKLLADIRANAEKGDAQCQYELGAALVLGSLGVVQDLAKAIHWYRKAAEQGSVTAQEALGGCYYNGKGVAQDYAQALFWYRRAAQQGSAWGEFFVAMGYANGFGISKDEAEAAKWLRKAAEQKHFYHQWCLGVFCYRGTGVAKDAAEAAKWWRKAAEQGCAEAQYRLGGCYATGEGVAEDAAEAVKWARKAAEQGYATAQYNLGCYYARGEGVAKDNVEAVKWWRKAAEQGIGQAQDNLAVSYFEGEGVAKDAAEAVKWARKAAEQGYAKAQYGLGVFYVGGYGVGKDYVEAYKWINLSAAQGFEPASKARSDLEDSMMTPAQIAEGQRLTREFNPRRTPVPGEDVSSPNVATLRPEASGTGFFISEDGYLVTNEHVVKESGQIRLIMSGGLIAAKVVKRDTANDLAILKADGKFAALPIASSRNVRMGAMAATVGFPNIGLQGFAPKLAKGEIAGLAGAQDDPRHFQISAPIQPGNSGGALVDERGNVIGVVVAKLSQKAALLTSGQLAENVNYAVKSSFLLGFLESLPEVASRLKQPNLRQGKFEDVVTEAREATVLVLVY